MHVLKIALNRFKVYIISKDSFSSAKNVVFSLLRILVDMLMVRKGYSLIVLLKLVETFSVDYCLKNQIFHYTCCNTPKRVTSWPGPSLRHCAWATQLLFKKCFNGGEPLATLCLI